MLNAILPALLLVTSTATPPAPIQAPPKVEFPAASPGCKVEQRVGVTDVVIEYARPSVKGRKVFGELEPYGKVWRTGADGATKVTFSTPVKFGGNDVPAGTYSLFTIPTSGEWTVILSKNSDQWGAYRYDAKDDQARVQVNPTKLAEIVETLEIGLRDVQDSSAMLSIAWEKTRVGVKIEVDVVAALVPQIEAVMAAPGKKPYLSAAMFYYEHDLDLKKALAWMDAGIQEQPAAFWMIYRKGLILEKMGDKKGAMAAADESLAQAQKAEGDLRDEYVRLNEALKARLK